MLFYSKQFQYIFLTRIMGLFTERKSPKDIIYQVWKSYILFS